MAKMTKGWITTSDVALMTGFSSQQVRRAVYRGLARGTKFRGTWTFDIYSAVLLVLFLILKRVGLSWHEIPAALVRARYKFHQGCAEDPAARCFGSERRPAAAL